MLFDLRKTKVAWASDSPLLSFVGNSRVAREIGSRLCEFYNWHSIAFNHSIVPNAQALQGWPSYNVDRTSGDKGVDTEQFIQVLKQINPDVLILSHDTFLFPFLAQIRSFFNGKIIGYFTIDGDFVPEHYRTLVFNHCDRILVTSKYGVNVIKKQFTTHDIDWVEHGVDVNLFGCSSFEEKIAKRNRFAAQHAASIDHSFVYDPDEILFFHIGHNQERKATFRLLYAWRMFVKNNPNAKVKLIAFIHSRLVKANGIISQADYDLAEFDDVEKLNIVPRLASDEELANLYASADYLLHPASNEGFGLTIAEALAARTTPIVCLYSGHTDFCNEHNSIGVDFSLDAHPLTNSRKAFASSEDIYYAIARAVAIARTEKQKQMQQSGYEMIKSFSWDTAADKFHIQIQKTLARLPKRLLAYYL